MATSSHKPAGPKHCLRHRRPHPHVAPARVHAERQHHKPVREERLRSLRVELLERGSLIALAAVEKDPAECIILSALLAPKALRLQGQPPGSLVSPPAGCLGPVRPNASNPGPNLRPPGSGPDAVDQREEHDRPREERHNANAEWFRPAADFLASTQELRQAVPEDLWQFPELQSPPAVRASRHPRLQSARYATKQAVGGAARAVAAAPSGRPPSGDQSPFHRSASASTTARGSSVHRPSTEVAT